MEIKLVNKTTGKEYDGYSFFIEYYSDGATSSLQTTLESILQEYVIWINGLKVNEQN